jgi:hypothetical protein
MNSLDPNVISMPVKAKEFEEQNVISHFKIKGKYSSDESYTRPLEATLDPSTDDALKADSVGQNFFSWIANSRISIWSTVKVLQSIRFYMLLGTPSDSERDSTDEQLNELTGSLHTAKVLHSLSPVLATSIQHRLASLSTYESLCAFFREEWHSLQTIFDALLPVIYKNLAEKALDCHQSRNENHQIVTFADVMSFVCEITHDHLSYINERIAEIESTHEEEKKINLICQTFSRMVDDFMTIALPDGINELPLSKIPFISEHYWGVIQRQVMPVLFYHLYLQFVLPMRENKRNLLLKMAGGESLASLAKMAGERAVELLPGLFLDHKVEGNQESLVVKMARGFSTLLEGSDIFKTWVTNWFAKELTVFGKSHNFHLKKLWKLLGGYIEPLLNHVFANMADAKRAQEVAQGRIPDAIGTIIIRLLSLSTLFYNENHKRIQERLEHIKRTGKDYKEDEVLLEIFKPLADDLFVLMGLDNYAKIPLPGFLRGLITGPLKSCAPAFLLRQYFAILNMDTNDHSTHQKLRAILLDPKKLEDPELAVKILAILHKDSELSKHTMFDAFHRNIWQESGTEKIASTLETICAGLASNVVDGTMKYYGISDQTLLKKDPLIAKFKRGLTSLVDTTFLKILVHAMETAEKGPQAQVRHPKYLVAFNIIGQLIRMVNRKVEHKDFIGLATELYAFAGVDPIEPLPFNELPGGKSLKSGLGTGLKNNTLPWVIEQIYLETMAWRNQLQHSLQELERNYHTTHSKWFCKVIAQYSTDYLRNYLRNPSGEAAKTLSYNLKDYFGLKNDSDHKMESFLKENLQKLAEASDPEFDALWPALTHYFEAAAAKFLAEFSKTIREIEQEHPDLTVDIAIQILKDTARHFSIVGKATQEAGVEQSFEVPINEMIHAFGKELHDGVPLEPFAADDVKNKVRLQGFFIPLTAKLFKLADLSIKDLPLPKLFKQQLGELTIKKILPLALLDSFQKLLEPQIRNSLMLNLTQMLYAAFNGNELSKREAGIKEAPSYPDPKQKHLYETCGYVVLELIKLIPDTTVQYVFMKEKVKNMSAQAIGDALMPYLSRWTLLQMFDRVMYVGVPNFHPSKWEGKQGREELVPLKAFVRPDGNMELKKVQEFKFHFTSTEGELKAMREAKIREAFEVRMELRNAFTKTISHQLHSKAWAFVKSLWTGFQEHLNDLIERMFSQHGLAAKILLDKILRKIFFDGIGTVLQYLFAPVESLVKFVSEKTVINRRSEDIIENLQSDLIENLLYKWTDTLLDSLIRLKKA